MPLELLHDGLAAVDVPDINAPVLGAADNSFVAVKARRHRVPTIHVASAFGTAKGGVRVRVRVLVDGIYSLGDLVCYLSSLLG